MSKPTELPRWSETAGGTPGTNIVPPTPERMDAGFRPAVEMPGGKGDIPASGEMNWFMRLAYKWLQYLDGKFETANADLELLGTGTKDGVRATGAGTGAGGIFDGGATGPGLIVRPGGWPASCVRGAINLQSVAVAPTGPQPGDLWLQGGSAIMCRITSGPTIYQLATTADVNSGVASANAYTDSKVGTGSEMTLSTGTSDPSMDLIARKEFGRIWLRGSLGYYGYSSAGTPWVPPGITVLPSGWRPPFHRSFIVPHYLNGYNLTVDQVFDWAVVVIGTDGKIYVQGSSSSGEQGQRFVLDGISFRYT